MKIRMLAVIALSLGVVACTSGRQSAAGFRLPENGDVERGKVAFATHECHTCHTVSGGGVPAPSTPDLMTVRLGGEVTEIRTDGYLVTSIIHPSHKIRATNREVGTIEGESRMPDYTATMTVRDLVDITSFLQSRYRLAPLPIHP